MADKDKEAEKAKGRDEEEEEEEDEQDEDDREDEEDEGDDEDGDDEEDDGDDEEDDGDDEEDDADDEDDDDDDDDEDEGHGHAAETASDEEDPTWWLPHAVLGFLLVLGLAGFFGAFRGLVKPSDGTEPTSEKTTTAKPSGAKAEAPTEIGAQHLLVMHKDGQRHPPSITRTKEEAKKRADEANAKIKKGAKFDDVVKEYSDEPGAADRNPPGDLRTFRKGAMVPAFENAAFALKVNEISGVVESPFGYHIIKRTK
jgi:parvulin-like peptidyl-prolyl isomerase